MHEEVFTASKAEITRAFQKWIDERNAGLCAEEQSNDGADLADTFTRYLKEVQTD